MELALLGVRCTMVDSRPLRLDKQQARALAARGCVPRVVELPAPAAGARPLDAQPQPDAPGEQQPALELRHVRALFGPELWRAPGFAPGRPSLLVGLHPDQATDAIVDAALELEVPFALVPCCVFPRLFPHRRVRRLSSSSGSGPAEAEAPVTSYAELVQFLLQKAAPLRAAAHVLGFEGANTVVATPSPRV